MEQSTRLRRTLSLRVLVFMAWALLASWPFLTEPAYRAPGFLFKYLITIWVALILALRMLAKAEDRPPRRPGEGG